MQVIPRGANFFGDLGTGLGELAGFKLGELVKTKQQRKERAQFAEGLAPILGKDTANFLSNLGPDERKLALQNLSSLVQLNEAPSSRQQVSELGGLSSMQQNQQQQPPQNEIQNALQQYFGQPTRSQQQFGQPEQQQFMPEQQQAQPQQQQEQFSPERARLIEDLFTSPQEKRAKDRERRENAKLELVERQANLKETKLYVDELKNKEKSAKESNLRLSRMEQLIDKGNLPNAALWSSLSKLEHAPYIAGLTAPIAEIIKGGLKWYSGNPEDIEEFEKLSSEFVKNAKQYFGSRITQKEVELYMQTVPTLAQTDRGKKKLINNIKSLNELVEIEAKAARSIIKSNGGVAPVDIEQQVQDKIGDKIDKVAKKFIIR